MTEASQEPTRREAETGLAPADEILRERALPRAILASNVAAIVVLDTAGHIVFVNDSAERILGATKNQLAGRTCTDPDWHITDLDGQPVEAEQLPFRRVVSTGQPVSNIRQAIAWPNGQRRLLSINGAPLREGEDPLSGAVFSLADITEQVQAEQQQKRLESKLLETRKLESLGALAGGIAHDFNNLLTAILGNAALARRAPDLTAPVLTCLEQIENASYRAGDLCKQMLAYAGKGRYNMEAVNLSTLVLGLSELLEQSASKKATLSLHLADNLPPVFADPTQLRQVVLNLVLNASEALEERSGTIALRTGARLADGAFLATTHSADQVPEGEYVFVEVADSGCDMSEETLGRIFDPFFTTKFTGRGLGLAAALGIIRAHRGALHVTSTPGQGTTFQMLLPHATLPAPAAPAGLAGGAEPKRQHTVLVVDDEEGVRALVGRFLDAEGFQTVTARHGREALAQLQTRPETIHLVLLDLTMPELSGEETLRELRRLRPDLPVLLMSGFSESEMALRCADQPPTGFLAKPFTLAELLAAVRQVLQPPSNPSAKSL